MGTVILLAKMAAVLLCFCGIMMTFHYRFKIDTAFAPVFASGTVISTLFAGGLLNIMTETMYTLYLAGFVAFVIYALRIITRKEKATFITSIHTLLFFALCAFAILYCKDIIFHLSDEISHWGTMIKEMCTVKGFPDARTVIDYKEYPPAAALFVYFFLFATGFSEPICYMAQAIFTFSCCVALLYGIRWKNIWTAVFSVPALLIVMETSEVMISSLLVDYLMPVMATALTIYLIENREFLENEPVKFSLLTMPVFLALCLIKTNAVALYAMYLCFVLFILFRPLFAKNCENPLNKKQKIQLGCIYLAPAAALFLWKNYIDKVYLGEGYDTVKFAITKENLLKNYYEKSSELIGRIISDVSDKAFTSSLLVTLLCCFVICFVATRFFDCEAKTKKLMRFAAVWSVLSWFIYMLGYGLMLVFLMPEWEFNPSSTLICFGRYVGTAAGYAIGVMLYLVLKTFVFNNRFAKKAVGYILCAALLAFAYTDHNVNPVHVVEYEIPEIATYTYDFTSRLDQSVFGREDVLGFYTGEVNEDSSWINNFHMRRTLLNRNIYMFNNDTVDGIKYEGSTDAIFKYLKNTDFIVQILPHENFVPLMEEMGIAVDNPDAVMYEIIKDENGTPIQLVQRQ